MNEPKTRNAFFSRGVFNLFKETGYGRHLITLTAAAFLAACGGGGGTGTAVGNGSGGVAAPSSPAQQPATMTFSGTAAAGAGITNALVIFKCVGASATNGSAGTAGLTGITQVSGLTNETARYRITMPSEAMLPCVVRVVGPTGFLHSAVDKNHTAQDVNITALTDLQLTIASGISAAAYFDTFNTELANKLAVPALRAAQKEVTDLFAPVVNLSGMQSLVNDPLVATVAGKQAGNSADVLLDQISAALVTHNKSLAQITSLMLEQKGGASAGAGAGAARVLWSAPPPAPAPAPAPAPPPPAPQTINFSSLPAQRIGSATPALSAIASSGLPVTFSSSTPAVCTNIGTALTLVSAGNCVVTANQRGNAIFEPAASVVRTFVVNAAPAIMPAPVIPAAQTISFISPATQTLGAATPALSAAASSGLPVTFTSGSMTVCRVSATALVLVSAGTCQITASQVGNASFAAALVEVRSFTVNPPVAVVTTETQSLACPAGQTGSISQSRIVTTTNGVANNGAWSTTVNTCAAPAPPPSVPPAPIACTSQSLSWIVGANSCTGAVSTVASGLSGVASDNVAPTTGSASFFCTNGNWGIATGATCNAPLPSPPPNALTSQQAARLLTQATFGPTAQSVAALAGTTAEAWLLGQMAMPPAADYVNEVQRWFDKGSSYRPGNGGDNYSPSWLQHKYWSLAINAPDQLRRRVVHALLQIHVVSLEDSNLYDHGRSVGQYVDNLGKHAFGNYRDLLQDVALSPVMGIYLSHIRNEKGNPATGRMPDENFAREIMQLFSIGLHQLNIDGTVKTDSSGKPLETYTNEDVIGLARVFTGWSWDMADGSNTSNTFKWGGPGRYETLGTARFDLKPMRVYPSFHETGVKSFLGVTIPQGTGGDASLKIALDTLFNHPNVGPFIGKQLIQRLVTSNPSPAYVQSVAQAFNNNGSGVRGDMAAVIRAVLLYSEARGEPTGQFGKLREPVLRVTQAARALQATSLTGRWLTGSDERNKLLQSPLTSPSVFNFYRPGYVPPNTQIATLGMVAPEFQIANETTVVEWVNYAVRLLTGGVGWTGEGIDVPQVNHRKADITIDFNRTNTALGQAAMIGNAAVVDQLNLLLFSGGMSSTLRGQILNAMDNQVGWNSETRLRDRQRVAAFIALTSSEYLIER